MKRALLLFFFIITVIAVNAQTSSKKYQDPGEPVMAEPVYEDSLKVFTAVEHDPEFPGGIAKFYRYLSKGVSYTSKDEKEGYQASFLFNFIVEKDGSISIVKELRRIPNTDIGKLLIKRIKESPKWKPAIQNGMAVRYRYNLPLHF